MQLICPTCGASKSRTRLSMRLETCDACASRGREVYLEVARLKPDAEQPVARGIGVVREVADSR